MKKRGHGVGKWNGSGGKGEPGETPEQTAIRETQEEVGVTPLTLKRVATIEFTFPPERNFDHVSTVYLCTKWQGEPQETEEMKPQWFKLNKIPYDEMWESDKLWLPQVLAGKLLAGKVDSGPNNEMTGYEMHEVQNID